MPKYYVESADVKEVVDAPFHKEAAIIALKRHRHDDPTPMLGLIVAVKEGGFDADNDDDLFFSTRKLLDELFDADS